MDNSAILKPATSLSTTETEKPNDSPHSDSQLTSKTISNTATPSDKTILTDATKGMENTTTPHSSVTANTGSNSGDKAITTDTTKVVENITVLHPNIASSAGEAGKIAPNDSTHIAATDIHLSDKAIATDATKNTYNTFPTYFSIRGINEITLGPDSNSYQSNLGNVTLDTEVTNTGKIIATLKDNLNSEMHFNLNIHQNPGVPDPLPVNLYNLSRLFLGKEYQGTIEGINNDLTFSYSEPNGQTKSCTSPTIRGLKFSITPEAIRYDKVSYDQFWEHKPDYDKAISCSLLERMDKTLWTTIEKGVPYNLNGQEYENSNELNQEKSGIKVTFNSNNVDFSFGSPDQPEEQRSHFLIETRGEYGERLGSIGATLPDHYQVSFTGPGLSCHKFVNATDVISATIEPNNANYNFPRYQFAQNTFSTNGSSSTEEGMRFCSFIHSSPPSTNYSHEII